MHKQLHDNAYDKTQILISNLNPAVIPYLLQVLELKAFQWRKKYVVGKCSSLQAGMKCINLCRLQIYLL